MDQITNKLLKVNQIPFTYLINKEEKTAIPLFLKQIGPYSFSNSSLENIKISHHITHIGNGAFFSCDQLKIADIPQNINLEEIGQYAFAFSSIESIFIPSHVKKLEESIFSCCNNLHQVDISADSEMISIEDSFFLQLRGCQFLRAYVNSSQDGAAEPVS